MNPQKIQGPGTAIKFLGVMWLGKLHIVPEAVIDKVQACPPAKNTKEVQASVGIWGLEDVYSPPGTVLHPLCHLVKKGHVWDWGSEQQATFEKEEY